MGKPCALCGRTDVTLTNEHIFGKWLRHHLRGPMHQRVSVWRLDPVTDERVTTERRVPLAMHQVKVRVLCEDCNKWGGRIESEVRPVVAVLGGGIPGDLRASGAEWLAAWALKIAIMREYTNPVEARHIPIRHARELRATGRPPASGVAVWAATSDEPADGDWWARSRLGYGTRIRDPNVRPVVPDAYLAMLTIARLAVIVVGCDAADELSRDMAAEFPETFVRLWPNPVDVSWPMPITLTGAEFDVLYENGDRFWIHQM